MNPISLVLGALIVQSPPEASIAPVAIVGQDLYLVPLGGSVRIPIDSWPVTVTYQYRDGVTPDLIVSFACQADIDADGDCGTDADIEAFFESFELGTPTADFDGDGEPGTSADIMAFFIAL